MIKNYTIIYTKFANHNSSQRVNPDNALKTERFGYVSLAYTGTDRTVVSFNIFKLRSICFF